MVAIKNMYRKYKVKIFGNHIHLGLARQILIAIGLLVFAYVFIYPLVYSVLVSFMSLEDLMNPSVKLIPTSFDFSNYKVVFDRFKIVDAFLFSVMFAGVNALLQTAAACITGYAFARFSFPGKKILLGFVLLSFVIPPQVLMTPSYMLFSKLGLIGNVLTFFIPATFGQGLKSSIFILIFYSFFSSLPKVLDEAGQIDGANPFVIFFKIAFPLTKPAIVLTYLFSFVWYWNETFLTNLYLGNTVKTLPLALVNFISVLEGDGRTTQGLIPFYESVQLAGVIVSIVPLIVFYFIIQKQFTESIEKTGITG